MDSEPQRRLLTPALHMHLSCAREAAAAVRRKVEMRQLDKVMRLSDVQAWERRRP